MTKRERVEAALAGLPLDRPPVSFWGHDYLREWSPEGLAEAMIGFFRRHDWDFLKVNPRATYYAEAWGCRFRPPRDPLEGPELLDWVVKSPRDLARIEPLDPHKGPFGEQLQALHLIVREIGDEAYIVQTVFSPLAVMGRLAGGKLATIRRYMHEHPRELHAALAAVAETLAAYGRACLEVGASGLFFATVEWACREVITEEEYRQFGRPYDLQVLAAVREAPFNILHVCRDNNMLGMLLDYPVAAFHWAATLPGNPSLGEVLARSDKAVIGGISEKTILLSGTPEQVMAEVREALAETGGRRLLLAPGCTIAPNTPEENLRAVWRALKGGPSGGP